MKKMIFSIFAFTFVGIFTTNAQISIQGPQESANMLSFSRRSNTGNSAIIGNQFINDKFASAYVNGGNTAFQIRFNPYLNIMEYNKDGEILNLTRESNTTIEFLGNTGAKYVLVSYNNKRNEENKDYLRVIYEGSKVNFYVLEKISLKAATKASNSYESDKQAEYIRSKDEIYMSFDGKTSPSPSKVKDVIKMMPTHEKEIKSFVKDQKIDFNKEIDLKKLGAFLDQLS